MNLSSLSSLSNNGRLLAPFVPSMRMPSHLGALPSGGFSARTRGHLAGSAVESVQMRRGFGVERGLQGGSGAASLHPGEVDEKEKVEGGELCRLRAHL